MQLYVQAWLLDKDGNAITSEKEFTAKSNILESKQ